MKKLGSDLWALIGLIVLFGGMSFLIAKTSPEMAEIVPHRTTYSNRPGGYKAAYTLMQQRGLPVLRSNTRPGEWPKSVRVMITATPYNSSWDESTAKKALAWVEAGNTLIVTTDETEKNDLTTALHLKTNDRGERDVTVAPGQPLPLFARVSTVQLPGAIRWSSFPDQALSLIRAKLRTKPGSKPAPDESLPTLLAFTRGKGRIFALSAPGVWENRTLDEADNARFLVQLVESQLPDGAAVAWDEFHQGYTREQSFWTVVGKPGQLAFYQIVAICLIAVYAAGRRFGLPRPEANASRVSSEYVSSLADLYRRARASDAALLGVYTAFRRDLCRTLGVPTETDDTQLAKQAATLADPIKRQDTEERLRRLLSDCALRSADQSQLPNRERTPLAENQLLMLAQELESFRKELSIGRTR